MLDAIDLQTVPTCSATEPILLQASIKTADHGSEVSWALVAHVASGTGKARVAQRQFLLTGVCWADGGGRNIWPGLVVNREGDLLFCSGRRTVAVLAVVGTLPNLHKLTCLI